MMNKISSIQMPITVAMFRLFRLNAMETPKNFIRLQQEELNVMEINELVKFPNCGAIANFIGITRDNFEKKKVKLKRHYRNVHVFLE